MKDLANFFSSQGHSVSVLTPSSTINKNYSIDCNDGIEIIRIRVPDHKGGNYLRRFLAEFLMPFMMHSKFKKTPSFNKEFQGIVWYSPSIFFGYLIYKLKNKYKCKTYLILRDIFPDWALDLNILKKGIKYNILQFFAHFSYAQANSIGVQSPNNLTFITKYTQKKNISLEVLWNWASLEATNDYCSIQVNDFPVLASKKILLYTGNMGIAQDVSIFLELADRLSTKPDIAFLFVGSGDDQSNLSMLAKKLNLKNTVFHEPIPSNEIASLCSQCDVGLFSLDLRHTTHNIPGKVISYLHNSLPVIGNINPGNDLVDILAAQAIGVTNTNNSAEELQKVTERMLRTLDEDSHIQLRCNKAAKEIFSIQNAYNQIIYSLTLK
ncbi:glycosyltransferase family 4 protein [Gammaproteobacteria bacterium]|nr:glycosyltransferase family 4 protein [Gammaproteobacteria bacterium]